MSYFIFCFHTVRENSKFVYVYFRLYTLILDIRIYLHEKDLKNIIKN